MPDQLNNTKEKGVIETITVNGATFEDAPCPINPNLINYFYGQNGTGKSTLAEQVKTDKGLTMQPGQSLSSYDVLVFNQDFVESNMTKVKSASGLGAVFMLDANNRRINGEISKIRKEIGTIEANIEGMNKALVADIEVFGKKKEKQVKSLFSACAYLRDSVPQLFFGYEKNRAYELYKSVSGFTGKTTENTSKEDLINFYNETIVESSTEENYPILSIMTFNQFSKEQEDLWTPFIDSSNSQFKDFLEEMSAANWFLEGYNQFKMMPNPQNKCPYCQQTLPEGFDDTVEKAFDKTYINGIERIKKFFEAYRIFHDEYIKSITDTSKEKWISEEAKKKFDAALKGIEAQFDANAMRIQKKLNDPAWKIQLVDLGPYVKQMLEAIYANNEMVRSASRAKKDPKVAITKARDMMFSLIMQENKAILDSIKDIDDDIEELKNTNKASVEAEKNKIKAKNADIDEKLAQLTNTGTLVDEINKLIRRSGFDGFHLEEIDPKTHEIMIYRNKQKNGAKVPAKRLSEGEKNFIMFLYFYFMVKGTTDENGGAKDKIVVIDDPVTSMDSQALHFIASLTKELIGICANNFADAGGPTKEMYIKQFFLLSHNPYFFREVSDDWISEYRWVNYYSVIKRNNVSKIVLKTKASDNPLVSVNDYPIKNAYHALWEQYNDATNDSVSVMNAARQIMDHYFIQMLRSTSKKIKEEILVEHREDFIKKDDNGVEDVGDYNIVEAILSCLTNRLEDDFSFDKDSVPADCIRTNMEKIFELTHQKDHYDVMSKV